MSIENLIGKTIKEVRHDGNSIRFVTETGESYLMEHQQDCCEHVSIEDIDGDLDSLIGKEITSAYKNSHDVPSDGARTITHFFIGTDDSLVIVKWDGYSNGYYGTGVSFWDDNDENSRW